MFLWLTLLTGVIYPLFITLVAQLTMSKQANGSFLVDEGKIVGTPLIAQKFTSERYFWPRPSAIDYRPLPSGGSNLGPTSSILKQVVEERRQILSKAHPEQADSIPSELLFASASGLDPHISPAAAYFQVDRVLKARNLEQQRDRVIKLIDEMTEHRFLYIIGRPCVNVFLLNRALDGMEKNT
jgi:K+-transporting ATPase ATPase C chain